MINTIADILKPVWAIGFAIEQPLHVVTLACSASGILKQLKYKGKRFCPYQLQYSFNNNTLPIPQFRSTEQKKGKQQKFAGKY
ncbi:MAG: hypothetical protein LBJ00_06800 [Planctomycetaceae bacterium]|nr:hypothetical protein [Planctomycetaceae bacterium]